MAIFPHQEIFKLLILFYCFFISFSSISTPQPHSWHPESKILHDFGDNFVRGISQYGSILAFALEDKIVFENPPEEKGDSAAVNKIGNITLAEYLIDKSPLLDFKIINETSVLVCNSIGCSVCKKTANNEPDCEQLKLPHTSFNYVAASLVDEKIFIRAVSNNKTMASIYVFEPTKTSTFELVKSAEDNQIMSEFTAVAVFSTLTHAFFVGSASRKDLAMIGSNDYYYNRVNHELRITRVCNNDQTKDLESRMDLTLACQGDDYQNLKKSIHNVATAATYFPDNEKLIISIKTQNKNTTICGFDVKKIQERFDHTWKLCQSDFNMYEKIQMCQDINYLDLPDDCFIFTMQKEIKLPFCQALNNRKSADAYDNCNLHITNNSAWGYTWLDNYKPFFGKPIYKGSLPSFMVLRESNDPSTLFAIDEDSRMRRIQLDPTKIDNTLMWRPARHGPHMLEYLKSSGQLLFVNPREDNIINYMHITCDELYQSCNNISWEDPLSCGFCANLDGSGMVMPEGKLLCQTGQFMKNICPPSIDSIKFSIDGDYMIHGQNFQKFKNPQITAGTDGCNIIFYHDNYILCRGSSKSDKSCNVTIIGELSQQYPSFALQKAFHDETPDNNTKNLKYLGFAAAFIILVAVIAAFYFCFNNCRQKNHINDQAQIELINLTNHGRQ